MVILFGLAGPRRFGIPASAALASDRGDAVDVIRGRVRVAQLAATPGAVTASAAQSAVEKFVRDGGGRHDVGIDFGMVDRRHDRAVGDGVEFFPRSFADIGVSESWCTS